MGDNLRIRKLRKDLVDVLNACYLPMEIRRMVLDDLLVEVTNLADKEIEKELAEEKSKESEDVENGKICENAMEHNDSI